VLEGLERANLFVVGLDNERQWYRYHHLFGDVLSKHQSTKPSQQNRELHRLASDWYKSNGFTAEAFDHALQSGNYAQAANIVEENAAQMVLHAELAVLQRWVQALPEEIVNQRPWLRVYHAWALLFSGESNAAEKQLQLAEACFSAENSTVMPVELQGHSSAIRAWISYQGGDLRQAVVLSQRAIEFFPGMDAAVRCVLAGILGQGCVAENNFAEAARQYADAKNLAYRSGNLMLEIAARCALGWLSELMGRLREAKTIYEDAIQRAVEHKSPSVGQAYILLANLYRERNDLDAARQNVEKSIEYGKIWGHVDALATGYLYLARINQAQNDIAAMNFNLGEMDNTIRGHALEPPTLILLEAVRARLWLTQGKLEDARRWAKERGLGMDDHLDYFNEVEYLTLVRIFMAENQLDFSAHLLARLQQAAESSGRWGNLIEILILQSEVFDRQGKTDSAFTALQKSLELAEPEGYIRVFLDQGAPMEKLLKQIKVETTSLKNYIRKLLASFNGASFSPLPLSSFDLIDPLSERELEVLRLVAVGKSNQQIADELVVATGTVKKHLNNIFGKLNALNRTECVARARELNLL
jgi:LuxR family maltose regulon positive regulatory protein